MVRVRAWMDAAGIADGPLFQRLDKAGKPRGRLSTQSIRVIIQRRAQDAGIEGRVSGHSLRVGSAQSLAARGAVASCAMVPNGPPRDGCPIRAYFDSPRCINGSGMGLSPLMKYTLAAGSLEMALRASSAWSLT